MDIIKTDNKGQLNIVKDESTILAIQNVGNLLIDSKYYEDRIISGVNVNAVLRMAKDLFFINEAIDSCNYELNKGDDNVKNYSRLIRKYCLETTKELILNGKFYETK